MAHLSSIARLSAPTVMALAVFLLASSAAIFPARADILGIVAAENVYGDIAEQIGGPAVVVTSILSNPDQDPHLFEASASVARAVADEVGS